MSKIEEKVEIVLTQWQVCVEMANSVSQRRDSMNNTFVTLNLAIVAAVSITWNIKSLLILVAGIVICVIWLFFIGNYKLLNKEKFNVINTIETELPVRPFNDEWDNLKHNGRYKDNTKLERALPVTFVILYVIAIIFIVIIGCRNQGGI